MSSDSVEGNCIKCRRRTKHSMRRSSSGYEYFECLSCGNKIDVKGFVYDNLDALDG